MRVFRPIQDGMLTAMKSYASCRAWKASVGAARREWEAGEGGGRWATWRPDASCYAGGDARRSRGACAPTRGSSADNGGDVPPPRLSSSPIISPPPSPSAVRKGLLRLSGLVGIMSRHEREGVRSVLLPTASPAAPTNSGSGSSAIRKKCVYAGCNHVSSGVDEKLVAHAMGSHVSNCHRSTTQIWYGSESDCACFLDALSACETVA